MYATEQCQILKRELVTSHYSIVRRVWRTVVF